MYIKNKLLIIAILILAGSNFVNAQQEFTMYYMPAIAQSTYLNSAAVPEYKFSISLPVPSVFAGFNNSALSVKELVDKDGVVDVNKFIKGLSENNNYVGMGANVELLHIRFKVADNFFSFNTRLVSDVRFLYPKDLIAIATKQDQGGYSFSGLGINATSYLEYGLGFTRAVPDSKWTYGGRAKLLNGIANIQTESSDLEINIINDDIYQYELDAKMKINAALGVDPTKIDKLEDLNINSISDARDVMKLNKGFAIDAGATYQFSDKLSFGVAINNLGFINWKSYVRNYNVEVNEIYEGVNLDEVPLNNSLDSLISVKTDSIFSGYADLIEEGIDTTNNAYSTWLPTNIFLSAHYQLTPRIRASGSLYTEFFNGVSLGLVAGINYSVSKSFDITTSWWWFRKSSANLGLGLVYKPGPVQFHLIMDNILPASFVKINDPELGIEGMLLPYQIKNFNLRFGVNLVFGRIKTESRLPNQGINKKKHGIRKNTYKPTLK